MNIESSDLGSSAQSGMAYAHWKNQAESLAFGVAAIRQGAVYAGIGPELPSEEKGRAATDIVGSQTCLEPRLASPEPDYPDLPFEHVWAIDLFADVAADAADAAADAADVAAIDIADVVDIILAFE